MPFIKPYYSNHTTTTYLAIASHSYHRKRTRGQNHSTFLVAVGVVERFVASHYSHSYIERKNDRSLNENMKSILHF